MSMKNINLGFGIFAALSLPAQAQDPNPDALHYQFRNQLGIIKYCIDKGFPSQQAAEKYEKFLSSLPVAQDAAQATLAEEKGRQGLYYYADSQSEMSAEQLAEGMSQTLEQHCKSFDENASALTGG
ncbi:hypothetical protein IB267_17325 [Ensifer sp. ENS09]|uniref:hypothetical protein n=1 Tax=Ensifer sp. ENS09 TaxID=2769263 RepID=UPI00177D36D0|nr:hypothetical protein [Ensifer sp. ENS09]MBD9650119.1 hypothetical protein [Ensifer sp. ENS09]